MRFVAHKKLDPASLENSNWSTLVYSNNGTLQYLYINYVNLLMAMIGIAPKSYLKTASMYNLVPELHLPYYRDSFLNENFQSRTLVASLFANFGEADRDRISSRSVNWPCFLQKSLATEEVPGSSVASNREKLHVSSMCELPRFDFYASFCIVDQDRIAYQKCLLGRSIFSKTVPLQLRFKDLEIGLELTLAFTKIEGEEDEGLEDEQVLEVASASWSEVPSFD